MRYALRIIPYVFLCSKKLRMARWEDIDLKGPVDHPGRAYEDEAASRRPSGEAGREAPHRAEGIHWGQRTCLSIIAFQDPLYLGHGPAQCSAPPRLQ